MIALAFLITGLVVAAGGWFMAGRPRLKFKDDEVGTTFQGPIFHPLMLVRYLGYIFMAFGLSTFCVSLMLLYFEVFK